ncbi:MAG: hypothetical protein JWN04_3462, partial [Myxococcaceae bacterium]|nr:hypothetical protein [Myxococcaceae bacterium]
KTCFRQHFGSSMRAISLACVADSTVSRFARVLLSGQRRKPARDTVRAYLLDAFFCRRPYVLGRTRLMRAARKCSARSAPDVQFKTGYRAQLAKIETIRERPFTSETVIELAAVFHVEPFADRYPIAPDEKRCPWCRVDLAGRNAAPLCGVFADRTLYEWRSCSKRFLRVKS